MQDSSSSSSPDIHQQLKSFSLQQPVSNAFFEELKKIWTIYTQSHPPQQFNINLPLHKLTFLFSQAIQQEYFTKLFKITSEDRQYYEISLMINDLVEGLSHVDGSIAKTVLQVFQNFAYDAHFIIVSLSMVLHKYYSTQQSKKQKKISLKIFEFPPIQMTQLKAHMVQNFISVQVVVIKVQQVKLQAVSMEFTCFDCKENFVHLFKDGVFSNPDKCRGKKKKECKSKSFIALKDKIRTIFIQRIKAQELDPEGRVPRQIICQLEENSVGKVMTGETIIVSGIIKTETAKQKVSKYTGIYTPYMMVNSIKFKKNNEIVQNDKKVIDEMRKDRRIFYSLIKSFCPTIYGHELVKAGLLLGLVGGSSKNMNHQNCFRQTSHVLLLGDPGIGKSQLLKYASEILPHSIYVSATSMSTSGLTVTINKQGNDQSLQAGALILADNGVCAIDQFDKASDSSSLLEVMEQQTISIAKAGIICQLKCRVGILASANPVQGCYNKNKSFMQNTKISNAILSRFDLIFLLVDKPDPQRDKKLSQHIMKIHNKNNKKKNLGVSSPYLDADRKADYLSLKDKYSSITQQHETAYKLEDIKKYLAFIKTSIHPTLSQGAAGIIKSFYLTLRENNPSNSFQITNRQLQSLVRLAMARARIQCREVVTEEDAMEVTQLMQQSLFDSFEEMGYNIYNLKKQVKKGMGKKNGELSLPKQKNLFISTLNQMQGDRLGNIWEWSELVKVAKDLDLNVGDFHNFVERLNNEGVLLQKGSKRYSFQGQYV